MTEFRGDRTSDGRRFAVVVSRFNEGVTSALLQGARDEDVDVAWVPGAFDIPIVAHRLAATGAYAGVVALGAVIRGETAHHEVVAHAAADGIRQASAETGVPIALGVISAENLAQAEARAGGSAGNRGYDAAAAVLEVASLLGRLP
ncbi:MAG: 6,7-dimethyl-8-ribityllumazine synthase [Actinomycetota bacterium]